MKKLLYVLMATFAVFVISCKEDEPDPVPEPPKEGPVITVPTGTTVLVGKMVEMEFSIVSAGGIGEVTAVASEGDVILDPADLIGKTSGTLTVVYVAPLSDGSKTVTLTVKDQQTPAKEDSSDATVTVTVADPSDSDLLVAKFESAPTLDGDIDDLWITAQKLQGKTSVPISLGKRMTYYNADKLGEENLDIFEGYEGEENNFSIRSGYYENDIYFLIEWEDDDDSKDRQSWYFDPSDKLWKGEHKYANAAADKFYEDKFSFLFPIGTVDGFDNATCYATCHSSSSIEKTGDKHTRHYLKADGQKIDMWHWKRVRGTHNDRVDDQRIVSKPEPWTSSTNGRGGDEDGQSGYSNNSQTLTITGSMTEVKVPLYVIPDGTDYYWIPEGQLNVEAKKVTAVDAAGVLTYDGGTIDPSAGGYEQGTGAKRFPSVITRDFTGGRADIEVKAQHTGTGWIAEVKRKLDTGDVDDVVFNPAEDLRFGFAIFNNAAIAHGIKPNLNLKFEQ